MPERERDRAVVNKVMIATSSFILKFKNLFELSNANPAAK